jgi:hypothetical protein
VLITLNIIDSLFFILARLRKVRVCEKNVKGRGQGRGRGRGESSGVGKKQSGGGRSRVKKQRERGRSLGRDKKEREVVGVVTLCQPIYFTGRYFINLLF